MTDRWPTNVLINTKLLNTKQLILSDGTNHGKWGPSSLTVKWFVMFLTSVSLKLSVYFSLFAVYYPEVSYMRKGTTFSFKPSRGWHFLYKNLPCKIHHNNNIIKEITWPVECWRTFQTFFRRNLIQCISKQIYHIMFNLLFNTGQWSPNPLHVLCSNRDLFTC